jgi:hypothetical protein
MTTMSIRDLTRSGDSLFQYDYVEIENKKSKTYQGIFIPEKYAKEMKKILDEKIYQEKQKKLNDLDKFIGLLNGKIGDDKVGDIKRKHGK